VITLVASDINGMNNRNHILKSFLITMAALLVVVSCRCPDEYKTCEGIKQSEIDYWIGPLEKQEWVFVNDSNLTDIVVFVTDTIQRNLQETTPPCKTGIWGACRCDRCTNIVALTFVDTLNGYRGSIEIFRHEDFEMGNDNRSYVEFDLFDIKGQISLSDDFPSTDNVVLVNNKTFSGKQCETVYRITAASTGQTNQTGEDSGHFYYCLNRGLVQFQHPRSKATYIRVN
jgi:hypothetical protein